MYFEEKLYPANDDGRADKSKVSHTLELFRTNYFGDDQIFLRVTNDEGTEKNLHLTKKQAEDLSGALKDTCSYIGYDNT